jgi:hypothetical protein
MKAQKAAVVSLLAGCIAYSISGLAALGISAEETSPAAAFAVDTVAADTDGHFTAAVLLENLPEAGLCAAEFALAYDAAALEITDIELLYDTGAQKAEEKAQLGLGPVFSYEDTGSEVRVRWGTALGADYWLKEERAFFTVSGILKDKLPKGTKTELRLVPAAGDTANAVIAAGYVDAEGSAHYCDVTVRNGAVWKPVDETGATMYGDLNLDGKREIADVVMMYRAMSEELALSAAAYANADCEANGVLTIGDVTLMLRFLNGETEDTTLGAH